MKIADLIGKNVTSADKQFDLLISEDASVTTVLQMMQGSHCEFVGIDGGYGETLVISKEELLNRLLTELNDSYHQVVELKKSIDESFRLQTDSIGEHLNDLVHDEISKLAASMEYLQEGVVILDKSDEVERANPSAKDILGLAYDSNCMQVNAELIKLGFLELLHNDPNHNEKDWGEYRVKNSQDRIIQILWSEINNNEGHILGKMMILKDVTDEKADEKAKTEFIAAITHELRTPLTIIQNSVSNILAGVTGKINKKTKQYLNTILSDCHRFDGLISDLLDMSKIETGKMSINRAAVNIQTIVNSVINSFKEETTIKNVLIVTRMDENVPVLCIDRNRVQQVVVNLVGNAIKHSHNGETIIIRVVQRKDDVVLSVEDHGIGIAPDMQKHIFNKFSQIDRQAGAGYKGSGLGLAICHGIMSMHGGDIWVESEPGLGSKFYISMPKTDAWLVLNKCISECAEQIKKSNGQFALASVEIKPIGEGSSVSELIGNIMRKLVEQQQTYMTTKDDMLFRVSDTELFFVIREPKKKNALYKSLSKLIFSYDDGLAGKAFECKFGSAVYPQDTGEILSLENLARQRSSAI